jgi:hypothetical protein
MMTAAEQLEFFRTRFGRVVSRLQLEVFSADLARLNLDVMSAALKQTAATATAVNRPPKDVRLAVLAHYERMAASIAQLFPVFFVFESAWRSFVAAGLSEIYGNDEWWHGVRDAVERGADTSGVTAFSGRPASAELVRTVTHVLDGIGGRIGRLSTTYELVQEASLGHLSKLIEGHWRDIASGMNGRAALGPLTWGKFEPLFRRVRRARNDAYHHRVISDRADVVAAAESLLDLLDIHLGSRAAAIDAAVLPQLRFLVAKEPRHS